MCPTGSKVPVNSEVMTPVELTYAKLVEGGFKGQFVVLDSLFDDNIGERIKLSLPAEAPSGKGPFVVKPVPTYFNLLPGVPFVNAGSSSTRLLTLAHIHPRSVFKKVTSQASCCDARCS